MSWLNPMDSVFYFSVGAVLGTLYFVLLLRTVRLYASQTAAIRIIPFYLARLAAAVLSFWLVAQQGAFPLIFALIGFLTARIIIQRWVGKD